LHGIASTSLAQGPIGRRWARRRPWALLGSPPRGEAPRRGRSSGERIGGRPVRV